MAESTCVVCATSFVLPEGRGRPRTVCSKACQYKRDYRSCDPDRRRERNREYNRRWKIENPEKYRAQRARNVEDPEAVRSRSRRNNRRTSARRRLERSARGTSGSYVWRSGPCAVCGTNFVHPSHTRTCSTGCSKALAADRKSERQRAKYQRHREAIIARDGGVCGICGDPVNLEASVPDLDAFTIDHIVPRARVAA